MRGLFSANSGHNFSSDIRYRMNGNRGFEFIKECAAALSKLRSSGPIDPVSYFRNAGQDNRDDADCLLHAGDDVIWSAIPTLGGNQYAGVED